MAAFDPAAIAPARCGSRVYDIASGDYAAHLRPVNLVDADGAQLRGPGVHVAPNCSSSGTARPDDGALPLSEHGLVNPGAAARKR